MFAARFTTVVSRPRYTQVYAQLNHAYRFLGFESANLRTDKRYTKLLLPTGDV